MDHLRKCFGGKHRNDNNKGFPKDDCCPLPVPPLQRRPFTPLTSQTNLTNAVACSSPFFARLSPEIRREILLFAFAGRTVHMDLQYSGPYPRNDEPNNHAGIDAVEAQGDLASRSLPQQWRWWSSICHHSPNEEPWQDRCRIGRGACFLYSASSPRDCYLGVMGWLLTCRQAYAECIDLFHSTNTFHLSGIQLLENVGSFIIPRRIQVIASLELQLDLDVFGGKADRRGGEAGDILSFSTILSNLEAHFPSLKRLYLSITQRSRTSLAKPSAAVLRNVENVLVLVDQFIHKLAARGQHTIVEMALPTSLYSVLEKISKANGVRVEPATSWPRCQRFWRMAKLNKDTGSGTAREDIGFWVRQGCDDTPLTGNGTM